MVDLGLLDIWAVLFLYLLLCQILAFRGDCGGRD